jgi:hypothetical protein
MRFGSLPSAWLRGLQRLSAWSAQPNLWEVSACGSGCLDIGEGSGCAGNCVAAELRSNFGVHASARDTSVFRDMFDRVCQAGLAGKPVLIVGPSVSVKTRLAVEAVREVAARHRWSWLTQGADMANLLDQGAQTGEGASSETRLTSR